MLTTKGIIRAGFGSKESFIKDIPSKEFQLKKEKELELVIHQKDLHSRMFKSTLSFK